MSLRSAVLLLFAVLPALASGEWIRVATPHFEVYTTAGERKGRDAALEFEKVRDFFERASPLKAPAGAAVRIILFRNEQQYVQYTINAVAVAFYAAGPTRDYIVMQDSPRTYPTAIHEYMHLLIRHSGLKIPLWLNEGWADVFSTLRPARNGVAIGDLLPGRVETLEHEPWLDFDALTSTTQSSRAYNEADRAGIFYAESWALAHMLYLAPDYRDRFAKFVVALHRGASADAACEQAYGKTSDRVYDDLRSYLARKKLYGGIFDAPLATAAENPEIEKLSDFDADLMLADLLAATDRRNFARDEYQRLDKLRPGRPEIAQGLGFIALSVDDRAAARAYFRKAFDEGVADPRMCLELARLDREANAPPAADIPVLERAIAHKPGYTEAMVQLGLAKLAARDFRGAIAALLSIQTIPPTEATAVYGSLAYASLETGDLAAARGYADIALKWAVSTEQRRGIAELTTLIDARSKIHVRKGEALARVQGIAANMACSAAGNRLEIAANGQRLIFDIPDPRAVEFSHEGGGSFEIQCGPQKPLALTVEYAPAPAGSIVAGVVRRIEF